jgi:hypothetical protein
MKHGDKLRVTCALPDMAQPRFAAVCAITMLVKQAYSGKRHGQNIFRATIFF